MPGPILPPPTYTPRPNDTAYSPPPSGRLNAQQANYDAKPAPRAEPPVVRTAKVSGYRVKVAKGDTLSSLSHRYGVSVEQIMSANNLPDGRLSVGQQLVMPGVSGTAGRRGCARARASAAARIRIGIDLQGAEGRHAA